MFVKWGPDYGKNLYLGIQTTGMLKCMPFSAYNALDHAVASSLPSRHFRTNQLLEVGIRKGLNLATDWPCDIPDAVFGQPDAL